MTESEWLTSTDPAAMLSACLALTTPGQVGFIIPGKVGNLAYRPSGRQLRLFAAACREHFHVSAYNGGTESRREGESRDRDDAESPERAARLWATEVSQRPLRAEFLRCLFGNPFRQLTFQRLSCLNCGGPYTPLKRDTLPMLSWCKRCNVDGPFWADVLRGERPEWMTGETVRAIAADIYESRRWGDLPVLADALEEAGCSGERCSVCAGSGKASVEPRLSLALQRAFGDDQEQIARHVPACGYCGGAGRVPNQLLEHLRSGGPHTRGCWATDAILGKE